MARSTSVRSIAAPASPATSERRCSARSNGSATVGGLPYDGIGLGLAVTKGFVEAMGGEITIDDTPGRRHYRHDHL